MKENIACRGGDGAFLSLRQLRAQLTVRFAATKTAGGTFGPAATTSTARASVPGRSAAAHAVSGALHVGSSNAAEFSITDGSDEMAECAEAANHAAVWNDHHHPALAVRRKHGQMHGKSYMTEETRGFIKAMFLQGKEVSSDKQHPSWTSEQLQQLHPMKPTLPSEQEIRNEISRLFARSKKAKGCLWKALANVDVALQR